MSLNNKGFAISGVLYSLLILFVTLFIGILTIFATTKFSLDKVKNDIISKLEPKSLKEIVTTSDENPSIPDCIINNTTCTAGTGVAIKVNDSKNYDFYVMSEDVEEGTITLIMNQNIGEDVAWIDGIYNSSGPLTALNYLESQTSSWTNIPLETYTLTDEENMYTSMTRTSRARMITHTEATGLGCTESSGSCPAWLYENLSSTSLYGYWTSSASSIYDCAFYVQNNGSVTTTLAEFDFGARPVITIKKS